MRIFPEIRHFCIRRMAAQALCTKTSGPFFFEICVDVFKDRSRLWGITTANWRKIFQCESVSGESETGERKNFLRQCAAPTNSFWNLISQEQQTNKRYE